MASRMTDQQKERALQPVRDAVEGWVFADMKHLPFMLARAEQAMKTVPAELLPEAREIVENLSRTVYA